MIASAQGMVQRLDTKQLPASIAEISGLQKTLTNANKLVLSLDTGYGDNTKFNRDLDRLMVQANDAVRSIRALADLLARHPEALIKGRPAGAARMRTAAAGRVRAGWRRLAACSSPNPVLYTIAPVSGTPQTGGPKGRRIAADLDRALPGALADRPLVGELSARCDVERLVGRAAGRDAEPGSDRGAEPATAAEHGHRRERRRDGLARRNDRAQSAAARRGRVRQSRSCRRRRASASRGGAHPCCAISALS